MGKITLAAYMAAPKRLSEAISAIQSRLMRWFWVSHP